MFEGVQEGQLDNARVSAAKEELERRCPAPGRVTAVVAESLVDAVRARTRDKQEAASYSSGRIFGEVGAKTMLPVDGKTDVVFDARLFKPGSVFASADTSRIAAHEGLHVAMNQRSETLSDIHVRRKLPGMTRETTFVAFAGIAVEEYRVERALCSESWWPSPANVSYAFGRCRDAMVEASDARGRGGGVLDYCRAVLTAFHELTVQFAYIAGEELAGGGPVSRGQAGWDWLAGPAFDDYLDALDHIPSATVATSRDELDGYAFELVEPLDQWLRQIGFLIEDRSQGLYFDTVS